MSVICFLVILPFLLSLNLIHKFYQTNNKGYWDNNIYCNYNYNCFWNVKATFPTCFWISFYKLLHFVINNVIPLLFGCDFKIWMPSNTI